VLFLCCYPGGTSLYPINFALLKQGQQALQLGPDIIHDCRAKFAPDRGNPGVASRIAHLNSVNMATACGADLRQICRSTVGCQTCKFAPLMRTFCKSARIELLQIVQICIFKQNQKVIEIDLASQANSVLLEASQHTKRKN